MTFVLLRELGGETEGSGMGSLLCLRGLKRSLSGVLATAPFALSAGLVVSGLIVSILAWHPHVADAARDERTISLYEIHLKETTTVTFKRDGKYIPEALKKLNYAMRDWRNGEVIKMDPKLFDLVWQLHKESGSKYPVHVISGHRSSRTNASLRRRGGGQAKKSQHIRGKAMDIHFPDVPMSQVRKAAFKLEVGGVGYYPTSAIPFVHVDTARVRAWPRMGRQQLAMLFPYGHTKHRPSRGGPLTLRDQKRARVRLAMLARKNKTRILLANASKQQGHVPGSGLLAKATLAGKAKVTAQPVILASLSGKQSDLLEVPGLNRHQGQLWINQAGNQTPSLSKLSRKTVSSPAGKWSAQAATRKTPLQLASLTPAGARATTPDFKRSPRARLWVNGSSQRASWTTNRKSQNGQGNGTKSTATQNLPSMAALTPTAQRPQATLQQTFDVERVAYAPAFDEEHPDELSYRPFQLLPLMSDKPVAQNTMLVAMVEPKYELVHELLLSSENIPMQFRPSSSEAHALWNAQFKGKAIVNIRRHAQNTSSPKPQRLAQR